MIGLAPYCFLLAFLMWALGERWLTVLMVAVSIFLVFDWFGGDPRRRQ
jgi:hypothetical protein